MDEIDMLTRLRASAEPAPGGLDRARAALRERTTAHPSAVLRPRRSVPRPAVRIGLAAAAVAAVVAGSVGLQAVTIDGKPIGGSASAAEALGRAADGALRSPAPVPGPDQWHYIRGVVKATGSPEVCGDGAVIPAGATAPAPGPATCQVTGPPVTCWSLYEDWVPTQEGRPARLRRVEGVGNPGSGHTPPRAPGCHPAEMAKLPNEFTENLTLSFGEPQGDTDGYYAESPRYVASLPTDPAALLAKLRQQVAADDDREPSYVMTVITDLLRSSSPAITPQLRSSLFRSLALVEGVELVGPVRDLLGRPATAISLPADRELGEQEQVLFDEATGQLLGERRYAVEQVVDRPVTRESPRPLPQSAAPGTLLFDWATQYEIVDRIGARK